MYIEDLSGMVLPDFKKLKAGVLLEAVEKVIEESVAVKSHKFFAITASGVHKICTETKGEFLSSCGMRYLEVNYNKRFEETEAVKYSNRACEWGNENESKALDAFTEKTGFFLTGIGENQATFTYGINCVSHPDGLIQQDGDLHAIVEVKCPFNPMIFDSYRGIRCATTLKEIAPAYFFQMALQQLAANCFKSYFVAFDPRSTTPLHYVEIIIDESDFSFLKNRIALADDYVESLKKEVAVTVEELPAISINVGLVAAYHENPQRLVEIIEQKAGDLVFDCSNSKGREACKTHAANIIKTITPALNASKELVIDAKKVIQIDLNFRKVFESGVREIAANARASLTAWESNRDLFVAEAEAEVAANNELERIESSNQARIIAEKLAIENQVAVDDFIIKHLENLGVSFDVAIQIVHLAALGKLGGLKVDY